MARRGAAKRGAAKRRAAETDAADGAAEEETATAAEPEGAETDAAEADAGPVEAVDEAADPEPPGIARGRQQLWAVAISLLGSVVLVAVLMRAIGGPLFLQLGLIGLLLFQTFRGRGWARWILVVLSGFAAYANGAAVADGQTPAWLFIALAAVYVASAAVLALSPPVQRFMEHQRRRGA